MKIDIERTQSKLFVEGLVTKLTLTTHTLVDSIVLESFLEELLSVGEDMPKQERKKYREKGRRKAH